MSVFLRRFLSDPGNDVLLQIESVNILDLEPPSSISGIGTGTVLLVGEFENGIFAVPTEVTSAGDLQTNFGGLGYTYGGVPANNCCAVARKADGALVPEYWNGNSIVQLSGKKFARLILCRVDTSVGSVQFTSNAFVTGVSAFRYALASGQTLSLDLLAGAGPQTATFTGTAATVTGVAGVYPTTFTGGNTLSLGYDGVPNFTVTFLSTDQTNAQVVARINSYSGFAMADLNAGQLRLTGLQAGNGAQVRVVTGSAGVLAQLGLTAATTAGTGNVANVGAVTSSEVATVVQTAIAGTKVETDSAGRLRISNVATPGAGGYIIAGSSTTAVNLGFVLQGTAPSAVGSFGSATGQGVIVSTVVTNPTLFVGTETLTLNNDNGTNFVVAFSNTDTTPALVATRINLAAGYTMADVPAVNRLRLASKTPGGNITVVTASAPAVLTTLGLTAGQTQVGIIPAAGIIPAGTVVTTATATPVFVTMQDVAVTAALGAGPYVVKIRHAQDDGTGLGTGAGTVTAVTNAPDLGSFTCINLQVVTPALTEIQIDTQYAAAINATTDLNSIARQVNVIWSARQSNVIRRALKANVLLASSAGMYGRITCIRPPLNTARATALSSVAEPGVGAYRDQRVIYTYVEANTFVPLIGKRGLAGGQGFTANGNVDIGPDGFLASIMSQLNPEENPGQLTPFNTAVNSIGLGPNIQGFTIVDYINFKAAGICALRIDNGAAIFQSGVTSVDPSVYPSLTRISRRRMADFIQDSIAKRSKAFGKQLSTNARRHSLSAEIRAFMSQLLGKNNPGSQRIAGYTLDDKTGNTPTTLGLGLYRIKLLVRTLASLDSIVIETTVGEQVQVNEVLPAAA